MKFPGLRKFNLGSTGFTLVEILVGMAITSLLAAGIVQAIYQVITINASSNARMTAVKQVEYAIDIMRRDAVMAQKITAYPDLYPVDTIPDGTLMFRWIDWEDNEINEVIYLLDGTDLKRRLLTGGVESNTKTIAKKISSFNFDNQDGFGNDHKISLTISSEVGGLKSATEIRTFDIHPRPAM